MDSLLLGVVCILATLSLTILWNTTESHILDEEYPIIYEDPVNFGQGSYFGYSLFMSAGNNNNSWIMVGAPRGNYSSDQSQQRMREPGQVYRCSLSSPRRCRAILPEEEDPSIGKIDGAWLGASIAGEEATDGRVVICGPRWSSKNDNNAYQIGICYWLHGDENATEILLPLYKKGLTKWNDEYKFGQAGFSISIHRNTEDKTILLTGAPGFSNQSGGVVLQKDGAHSIDGGQSKREVRSGAFETLLGPVVYKGKDDKTSYFGYQVILGHFLDKVKFHFVASAPRAANLKGQVLIFDEDDISTKPELSNVKKVVGIQIGEYFGASLAVGDLDKNGFDDLIVGAPLYTKKIDGRFAGYEEGRISIIFGGKNSHLSPDNAVEGKVAGARFGSAVSFLGKLHSDYKSEIGVGAPYEDEGRGVVYILTEGEHQHWDKIVQRLTALDIYPQLRGFGSSIIVHPVDIDGNGWKDIAVGAHKSGHAAIFRGKPTVKWIHTITSRDTIPIDLQDLWLLKTCIKYQGNNASQELDVKMLVTLDPIHQRCHIKNQTVNPLLLHLKKNIQICNNITVTFMDGIENVKDPVEVNIKYLHPEKQENKNNKIKPILISKFGEQGEDHFCKTCLNSHNLPNQNRSIPFMAGCGNQSCRADLKIEGSFPGLGGNTTFTVGLKDTLRFEVKVINKNNSEDAYHPSVYIEHELPTSLKWASRSCSIFNTSVISPCSPHTYTGSNYIRCYPQKVLKSMDKPLKLYIDLDMTEIHNGEKIKMSAWTKSASEEIETKDNCWYMDLPLHYAADIGITGEPDKEQYDFKKDKNEARNKVNVLHTYKVQKVGYSPVEKVNVEFYIPYAIKKHNGELVSFLKLKSLEGKQDEQTISCAVAATSDQIKTRNESLNKINFRGNNHTNYAANQVPSNRTFYLNCSSTTRQSYPSILCMKVNCITRSLLDDKTVVTVELWMELELEPLKEAKKKKDIILLETLGAVRDILPASLQQPAFEKSLPDEVWTSTLFIGDIPIDSVESWIIALAVIAGIVVLILLGLALYKAGFFQRKKKEELDELKNKMVSNTTEELATTE